MILAYEFDGASENFAFFLKFYAQKSGLKFSIKKELDLTTLYAKGSQDELLRFLICSLARCLTACFCAAQRFTRAKICPKAK